MNIKRIILPLIPLLVGLVAYLCCLIRRTYRFYLKLIFKKELTKRVPDILVTLVLTAGVIFACRNFFSFNIIVMVHFLMISALTDLILFLIRKISTKVREQNNMIKLQKSLLIPLVLTIIVMIGGYVQIKDVVRQEYTVYTSKVIPQEGYKVAMISDLHLGNAMDCDELSECVQRINSESPDIFVLCGDLVDNSTSKEEALKLWSVLAGVKTKYGIYYVYGNHDRSCFGRNSGFTGEEYEKAITDAGIIILEDDVLPLTEDLTLIGRGDAGWGSSTRCSSEVLAAQADKNTFLLLLDHQPIELEKEASLGYDLQLSGHTHGGQFWPVASFSEAFGLMEKAYGYERIGDYQLIVSSGISAWGYPFRTGCRSEYVIVNILPESD